jgi:phosphopantothenoylcysteine decarboxylase/phosphopantothenate--cysteine ligase
VTEASEKLKKTGGAPPNLTLAENPDILATISRSGKRPGIVVGFAAETEHVTDHAVQKLKKKGCDLIIANDVGRESGVFGGDRNTVHLVSASGVEHWPNMSKDEVAQKLMERLAQMLVPQQKAAE